MYNLALLTYNKNITSIRVSTLHPLYLHATIMYGHVHAQRDKESGGWEIDAFASSPKLREAHVTLSVMSAIYSYLNVGTS